MSKDVSALVRANNALTKDVELIDNDIAQYENKIKELEKAKKGLQAQKNIINEQISLRFDSGSTSVEDDGSDTMSNDYYSIKRIDIFNKSHRRPYGEIEKLVYTIRFFQTDCNGNKKVDKKFLLHCSKISRGSRDATSRDIFPMGKYIVYTSFSKVIERTSRCAGRRYYKEEEEEEKNTNIICEDMIGIDETAIDYDHVELNNCPVTYQSYRNEIHIIHIIYYDNGYHHESIKFGVENGGPKYFEVLYVSNNRLVIKTDNEDSVERDRLYSRYLVANKHENNWIWSDWNETQTYYPDLLDLFYDESIKKNKHIDTNWDHSVYFSETYEYMAVFSSGSYAYYSSDPIISIYTFFNNSFASLCDLFNPDVRRTINEYLIVDEPYVLIHKIRIETRFFTRLFWRKNNHSNILSIRYNGRLVEFPIDNIADKYKATLNVEGESIPRDVHFTIQ